MNRVMANVRWPTIIAIAALLASTWYQYLSPWGVLFIWWSVQGIRTGEAFVVERIHQGQNPILFWIINVGWLASGVYYIWYDISLWSQGW